MTAEIPSNLIGSMIVASLMFAMAVWLLFHIFGNNRRISSSVGLGLIAWYAGVFFLGRHGFFGFTVATIPFIAFGFVASFILGQWLYRHQSLKQAFATIPIPWAIGVQIFRLMGYGFLTFYSLGLIPGEFALPTGWGDVFIGLTAIPVALIYAKWQTKSLAVIWNYLGIADLALALTLGLSTYPRPIQVIPSTPDNTLIALFPLVMVPLLAVPVSIVLHLLTLRKIRDG